ncbi:MAG TPA: hypothetical protein VGI97_04920 [Gemmatimonadaceae bacterium]
MLHISARPVLLVENHADNDFMFWWYERGGEYSRAEVLPLPTGGYELRVVGPDGTESVEQFDAADRVARRRSDIEDELRRDGWSGPHGWYI